MQINNVNHLKKFKNIKEISEIIKEINQINKYLSAKEQKDLSQARKFLNNLALKYAEDLIKYNMLNPIPPNNIKNELMNAKKFLLVKASNIIKHQYKNYKQ